MKLQQRCYQNGVWNAPLPDHLDGPTTVCFTFFAPDMDIAAAVGDLKQALPQSQIIGCSGAGEIKGTLLKDHALVATVAQFERTAVKTFCQTITTSSQSFSAGISLAALIPQEGLRAIYMLSEGLTVNGTELMRGLRSTVPGSVTIAGGLAGDGTRFKSTRVLYDQVAQPGQIVAVALYGDNLIIGAHARGGWLPFGPERRITKSTDNILYALDNRPALALYKEFLGHSADGLPASALHFPLLLGAGGAPLARNIVRTILAIDEKDQSMTFAGDMPMGEIVRLMRSTEESLVDAANSCAEQCANDMSPDSPVFSLMVSCVGRRVVLGSSTESEIESVFNRMPAGSTQAGFYSYGELAPNINGFCDLHNQTITLTWLQEKGAA